MCVQCACVPAGVGLWIGDYNDWPKYGQGLEVWLMQSPNDFTSATRCSAPINLVTRVRNLVYCPLYVNSTKYIRVQRTTGGLEPSFVYLSEVEVYRGGQYWAS